MKTIKKKLKKYHNHQKRIKLHGDGYASTRINRLVKEGFSEYTAKKYGTAIFHYTYNSYLDGSTAVNIVKYFFLKGKDKKKFGSSAKYKGKSHKFNTCGEYARALQNFILKRVKLVGPYNPKKILWRANDRYFLNKRKKYDLQKMEIGTIFQVDSILGTSTSEHTAKGFCAANDILMKFEKGISTAISIADISEIEGENEVLIGRGIKLKLVKRELKKYKSYSPENQMILTFREVKGDT